MESLISFQFEAAIPSGLPVRGAVLADHVRSVDFAGRNAEFVMKLDTQSVRAVSGLLGLLVGTG